MASPALDHPAGDLPGDRGAGQRPFPRGAGRLDVALVDVVTARPQVLNAGQVRQVAGEMQERFRAAAAVLGPMIPGPRRAAEDTPRPIVTPPSLPSEPRIRITGALRDPAGPSARSAGQSAERERASRERAVRIALLTLLIAALVTAIVFAGDIGAAIARLLT